jgi:hypothetical protein
VLVLVIVIIVPEVLRQVGWLRLLGVLL